MATKIACRDCPFSWVFRRPETAESRRQRHRRRTGHGVAIGRMGEVGNPYRDG